MTHSTDFFEQVDDYCLDRLQQKQKIEFEAELLQSPELRKEVEIQKEIWEAINEKDILTLKEKLEKVVSQDNSNNQQKDPFELFDEFANIHEISEVLSKEELINFYDSLPKVHAYHHKRVSKENIQQFYKDHQSEAEINDLKKKLDKLDFIEFEGLEDAILEKDILKLRQTLKLVAKTVEPRFTVEDIDEFVNGDLSGDELIEFEKDFLQNQSLKEEVQLHKELQKAVWESDVINLGNKVANIIRTESSWNVSEKSIEDYIDGCLEGKELEEFTAELKDNTDLRAEVKLRKQINELLAETDILDLRNDLQLAKEKTEVKKQKKLIETHLD